VAKLIEILPHLVHYIRLRYKHYSSIHEKATIPDSDGNTPSVWAFRAENSIGMVMTTSYGWH